MRTGATALSVSSPSEPVPCTKAWLTCRSIFVVLSQVTYPREMLPNADLTLSSLFLLPGIQNGFDLNENQTHLFPPVLSVGEKALLD